MSAINTISFQNSLCIPHTAYACVCFVATPTTQSPREPVVTARWQLETAPDGSGRLVRHWFKNERIETFDSNSQTRRNAGKSRRMHESETADHDRELQVVIND